MTKGVKVENKLKALSRVVSRAVQLFNYLKDIANLMFARLLLSLVTSWITMYVRSF